MIYELRIYDAMPGKLGALNERFANVTLPLFAKHNMKVVGFWTDEVGVSSRLTYILGFNDMDHREKAWAAFRADPERAAGFAASEADGPLLARVKNKIMRPTAYSPLQ